MHSGTKNQVKTTGEHGEGAEDEADLGVEAGVLRIDQVRDGDVDGKAVRTALYH